jgi:hypothetical protein
MIASGAIAQFHHCPSASPNQPQCFRSFLGILSTSVSLANLNLKFGSVTVDNITGNQSILMLFLLVHGTGVQINQSLKFLAKLINPSTGENPSKLWRASEDIPFGRIGVSLHLLHIHTIGGEKPHTSAPSPITL